MSSLKQVTLLGLLVAGLLVAPGAARPLGGDRALLHLDECPEALQKILNASEIVDGHYMVLGSQVDYANGTITAYTLFDAQEPCAGGPAAVGVQVSNVALDNMPGPDAVSMQPPASCKTTPGPACFMPFDMFWLKFSEEDLGEKYTPFTEMELDWNPMGHVPPGLYDVPHFDFHFYLVPKDEVMNISAGPCNGLAPEPFTLANLPIPESCMPGDNYTNLVATAPSMGNHLLSILAPEVQASFAGQNGVAAWNETFIWGTYSGQITFLEPMIKRSYLMSEPDMCKEIPGMPQGFAVGGYKPTTYCIQTTDEGVKVEMRDFKMFEAGCADEDVVSPASFAVLDPRAPPLPTDCVLPEY